MRVLFLNQYFPPDPAPTGILFRELGDALVAHGHEVDYVDAGAAYRDGQKKGSRMKRELASLWRMLRAGRAARRADAVISGTSPPMLAVIAAMVARKHRAPHFHWAMDVYPEIATALGEIRPGSLLEKFTRGAARCAYRQCAKVVVLDEDMADIFRGHGVEPACVRPWVFRSIIEKTTPPAPPSGPWTWIYSGNLGRAHEWETLLAAQALLEQRDVNATLLFQGGGPSWPSAQEKAAKLRLRRCLWRDYVPEGEIRSSLLAAHALVVTQRPPVRGLLWPSKLGLVLTLPRPLVFIGPPDGAIAGLLRSVPHAATFTPGDAAGLAGWIERERDNPRHITDVLDPATHRKEALAAWMRILGVSMNEVDPVFESGAKL